ncbi:hypothetical protein HZC07_02150 [Candidatus Micrarchaeota archaeon]|nr:hypothetical protein [Candidatus Micrarchaeota archaeon]
MEIAEGVYFVYDRRAVERKHESKYQVRTPLRETEKRRKAEFSIERNTEYLGSFGLPLSEPLIGRLSNLIAVHEFGGSRTPHNTRRSIGILLDRLHAAGIFDPIALDSVVSRLESRSDIYHAVRDERERLAQVCGGIQVESASSSGSMQL